MNISVRTERMAVQLAAPLSTKAIRNSIPAVDGLLSQKPFPEQSNALRTPRSV